MGVNNEKRAVLILKDGTIIHGKGFGALGTAIGELVFTTSMQGYQEALTDPSYAGQILMMTYPLIGNYGINKTDFESDKIQAEGFVVRQPSDLHSDRDATKSLNEFLKEHNKPGIYGIDTRALTRKVRNFGVMPATLITYVGELPAESMSSALNYNYSAINFVEKVSTKKPLTFGDGGTSQRTVVLIDYGVKLSIIRELVTRNLKVVVVPHDATAKQIKSFEPHGILLSNGPGDPAILTDQHKTIRELVNYPIFGICLGHQLIAHAFGGDTYKLKFGHRGSNHPVLDKVRNRLVITTQNHGYAIKNMPKDFEVTHEHANDGTIEGIHHKGKPIFSVQYHPEASAGPHDSKFLFDEFVKIL
ncbi:TPA: glutamine-hydrolyzing carbamoyl-phosphate synthase small subunit [Candidatus Micrarchaeota archaeon]|nr:glutamine-hydrolyzing carbamoyl-phosphate synthase small subunit [Candidatus Micrarchaeota archaeon]